VRRRNATFPMAEGNRKVEVKCLDINLSLRITMGTAQNSESNVTDVGG
jgi:hypothetical protein